MKLRQYTLLLCLLAQAAPVWAASIPATGAFAPIVDKACTLLSQSAKAYQAGNTSAAQIAAINAYFKVYDAELEPYVRTTLGNKHTFEMEQAFNALVNAVKTPGAASEQQKAQKMAQDLCAAVTADAVALTKEKISPKPAV